MKCRTRHPLRYFGGILMKIRLLSGTVYIAILVAFFCLKIFVHDFFFDGLIYVFGLIGTFEMLRAVKDRTTKCQRAVTYAYAATAIPAVALLEYFFQMGVGIMCVAFFCYAIAILSLLVFNYEQTNIENTGISLLSGIYPTLLLCLMVLVNHVGVAPALAEVNFGSNVLMLLVFVVSPSADTIAYVFGFCLRKVFPQKLAPKLSPNKTVIGGVGGLVGGMLGALVLYFLYNAISGSFADIHIWLPIYLGIGLLGAIATAFGDLVESSIKRKLDIKDMGNIMPGHGGALDRLDGTLFATVAVYAAYILIRLFI